MSRGPVLETADLSVTYPGGTVALAGVDLRLQPGEILGITGPSGCGKSTLCLCLAGIIPHNHPAELGGEVRVEGQSTRDLTQPQIATRVGIVFQDPVTQLFLPRIGSELAFGPENLCRDPAEIRDTVQQVARLTAVDHLLGAHPHRVSGGQQQLAALAATLALEPQVLVLDEAMSQLDQASTDRILEVVGALPRRGVSVVMVDHSASRLQVAGRVLCMEGGRVRRVVDPRTLLEAAAPHPAGGRPGSGP